VTLGAPFLPGGGDGLEVCCGVSVGLGEGISSVGDGVAFLCFDFLFGVGLGEGVGEIFFCRGEVVGDGVGVVLLAERFRCLRVGAGVGVGAKIFLIFVPTDSSALPDVANAPNNIATIKSALSVVLYRRIVKPF